MDDRIERKKKYVIKMKGKGKERSNSKVGIDVFFHSSSFHRPKLRGSTCFFKSPVICWVLNVDI